MKIWMRLFRSVVPILVGASLASCGGDTPVDPGNGGNGGGPGDLGPLRLFQVAVRPQVFERASTLAGSTPNPVGVNYFLSVFFTGGATDRSVEWDVPTELGVMIPNTDQLDLSAATVTVKNDGRTPLGFYDITATGTSAGVTSSASGRFAVAEANWMKHERTAISDPEKPPDDLISYPTYAPRPDGGDDILYVAWPNDDAVNLMSIVADRRLDQAAVPPRTGLFRVPSSVTSNPNSGVAADLAPDASPVALGRDEIIFSSEMDIAWQERIGSTNRNEIPLNLWIVRRPDQVNTFIARPITFDSSFASVGTTRRHYAFDYTRPRWDRSPTGWPQDARIGFLGEKFDPAEPNNFERKIVNLFTAVLRDLDGNATSDTLVEYRQITDVGSINSFDWHPNGQYLYYTTGVAQRSIFKVDVNSRAEEEFTFTSGDSLIERITNVSVFDDKGSTLLAFEATSENFVHLYVYHEDDDKLVRVNRYPYSVAHTLFPRWHPVRREIVFVSDYGVAAWSNFDPTPIGNPDFEGRRRTVWPSVWTIRLADRP